MKSRDEFVISQGWGTSSGLRALARIQLLRRRESHQVGVPLVEVDTDEAKDANVNGDSDETWESASRP
jgi:hypothetical protein